MNTIIMPPWFPRVTRRIEPEWTWRGLVDDALLDQTRDACIKESTDNTWYGYQMGSFGELFTGKAVILNCTKWHADGTVEVRFGVNGDEQLQGLGVILFIYNGSGVLLTWDAGNSRYFIVDTNLTGFLIGDFVEGKERCFAIQQAIQEVVTHLGIDVTHLNVTVTHGGTFNVGWQ